MIKEYIPELVGSLIAVSALFSQIFSSPSSIGWVQLALQAGMTGVVFILLLKFFPDLLRSMKEMQQKNIEFIERREKHHQEEVRQIINQCRICREDQKK